MIYFKTMKKISLAYALMLLVLSQSAHAEMIFAPPPVYDPKKTTTTTLNSAQFQRIGSISKKNAGERSLIISGQKYYYGINTKVHTSNSNFSSVQTLAIGTKVGVKYTEGNNNQRLLYEVWIIPANAKIAAPSDY